MCRPCSTWRCSAAGSSSTRRRRLDAPGRFWRWRASLPACRQVAVLSCAQRVAQRMDEGNIVGHLRRRRLEVPFGRPLAGGDGSPKAGPRRDRLVVERQGPLQPSPSRVTRKYSRLSARAVQLASMMLPEEPTVCHWLRPSVDSISTRTTARVSCPRSTTRTL